MRGECGEDQVQCRVELLRRDGLGAEFATTPQNEVESNTQVSVPTAALLCE